MPRVLGTSITNCAPPLALLVLSLAYLIVAYQYPPTSRVFPVMVAWAMLGLVGLDLVSRTQTRAGRVVVRWLNPASTAPRGDAPLARRELAAILSVAGFVAGLVLIGILYAIPLFVFTSVRWRGKRSYVVSLGVAAATTLFIWLLFARLLRIELYAGLFGGGG